MAEGRALAGGGANQRRGTAVAGLTVDRQYLVHGDGRRVAIVESGELDVNSLDPRRRGAAVAAFDALCRTLTSPLQIVVQVRRQRTLDDVTTGSLPGFDAAISEHWKRSLAIRPVYRRRLLFVAAASGGEEVEVQALVSTIADGLRAAGATASVLAGADLAGVAGVQGRDANELDRVSVLAWNERMGHALMGDTWVQGYRLSRLPGTAVEPGWLRGLLGVETECDIAFHFEPTPINDAVQLLGKRLRVHAADRLLDAERGRVPDARLDVAIDSALDLRDRIARNAGTPLRVSLVAVARGDGRSEMTNAAEVLRGGFAVTLAQAEPTHFRHLQAMLSAQPLGVDLLERGKLVDSAAAATLVPWVSAGCDEPGGYVLGAQRGTGNPVRVAPFDAERHSNANVAVLATSGHGKSYAVGGILLEAARRGVGAVVVDPEGEYERLVGSLRGQYIHLRAGSSQSLNVFDIASGGGDGDDACAVVAELINVLAGGTLSQLDRARVYDAVVVAEVRGRTQLGRTPILGDCLEPLEARTPAVAAVVRRFCEGPLAALFNRPTSVRLAAGIVGLSLRDLRDELLPAATYLVGEWLWHGILRDRRRRHLVFDEVGILSSYPALRQLLVRLARRCRKYGSSLVVATQNARDLLGTEEGSVVATNCSVVLLGGHRAWETARMQDAFGLTDRQRLYLETTVRGEFLLLSGDRRVEMRVDLPPLYHQILTGGASAGSG